MKDRITGTPGRVSRQESDAGSWPSARLKAAVASPRQPMRLAWENHKNMLGQHAQRQDQSFKAMLMAAMGANQQQRDQLIEPGTWQSEGATMGGDVLVTGDINIDNHPPQPASASPQAAAPQPQPQPAAQPAQKSSVWPWLAGAAGTGVVGTALGLSAGPRCCKNHAHVASAGAGQYQYDQWFQHSSLGKTPRRSQAMTSAAACKKFAAFLRGSIMPRQEAFDAYLADHRR
jgi:hypothetical protein